MALDEATAALAHGDVPVGAIVVRNGVVIGSRHNERELTGDPTAHAEVLALRDAAEAAGSWRLDGATIVVTLEPCLMCAGALLNSRIDRLVYGAADMKAGACLSLGSTSSRGSLPMSRPPSSRRSSPHSARPGPRSRDGLGRAAQPKGDSA